MPSTDDSSNPTDDGRCSDSAGPQSKTPSSASDRPPAVHIRFANTQGPRLRRAEPTTCRDGAPLWAERPLLLQRADGTYELIGSSANLDGLARWILSHGSDAEVQSPDQLRRRVAVEARQILRKYKPDP